MFETQINRVADTLKSKDHPLLKGLSENQILEAQEYYNIVFPPDLKELLMTFVPCRFYNWANLSKSNIEWIQEYLRWPIEGILFDVEHNAFWMEVWGEKPSDMGLAQEMAEAKLKDVPPLIPLYSHRYLPSTPCEAGNPVYSVYQTDIIFYGKDIWDYIEVEFCGKAQQLIKFDEIKFDIPFWGDIVS